MVAALFYAEVIPAIGGLATVDEKMVILLDTDRLVSGGLLARAAAGA